MRGKEGEGEGSGRVKSEVLGSVYEHMKKCMLVSISGARKMVHFMASFIHPILTEPHTPLGEPLSVPQPPGPEY